MKTLPKQALLPSASVLLLIVAGVVVYARSRPQNVTAASAGEHSSFSVEGSGGIKTSATSGDKYGRKSAEDRTTGKLSKEDAATQVKAVAPAFISLVGQSLTGERGGQVDEDLMRDIYEKISTFDREQLKQLFGEILATDELDDSAKAGACMPLLSMLARTDPVNALKNLTELKPLFLGNPDAGVSAITLLDVVGDIDPLLAATWLDENPDSLGEIHREVAQQRIIGDAAKTDPALAFTLIDRMKISDTSEAMKTLVGVNEGIEMRASLLSTLRSRGPYLQDPAAAGKMRTELLDAIARAMAGDPAESAEGFIKAASLNEAETGLFIKAREDSRGPD